MQSPWPHIFAKLVVILLIVCMSTKKNAFFNIFCINKCFFLIICIIFAVSMWQWEPFKTLCLCPFAGFHPFWELPSEKVDRGALGVGTPVFSCGSWEGAQETQGEQVALFVPTSSAALGIAFKASLMLCSHLHEQSGCTGVAIAMASPSEIWCKDITFLCTFQKTSQLFLPIFGSSERFCAIMHDTARWCTIAVEQARSVTHLSLLIGGSLQNCTGQNHCSKIGQVCKNPRL